MLFTITATATSDGITHQIPTFYLSRDVQSIVSKEQMGKIVNDIVNPCHLPGISVSWDYAPNIR